MFVRHSRRMPSFVHSAVLYTHTHVCMYMCIDVCHVRCLSAAKRLQWNRLACRLLDFDSYCLYTWSLLVPLMHLYSVWMWMTNTPKRAEPQTVHNNNKNVRSLLFLLSFCVCFFSFFFIYFAHSLSPSLFLLILFLLYSFKCGVATYFQRQRFRSMLSPILTQCALWCK